MKTIQALRRPWNVVELISLWSATYGGVRLAGGHGRPWAWLFLAAGATSWVLLQVLRWRPARDDRLRQRYTRTVEYSPLHEFLLVLGLLAIMGFLYWLVTTFLLA